MNIEKIHKSFVNSRILFFCTLLALVLLRLYRTSDEWDNPFLWSSLLIQITISLLLLQLNHIFTIIRTWTYLPALLYLLFICCNSNFYYDVKSGIITLCAVFSYLFLFHSYQKQEAQTNALNISLVIALGSLFWRPLLFLFPIYLYGFYRLRSLNIRVFLAGLTGFFVVYLFVFVWSVSAGDWTIFLRYLPKQEELFAFQKPDFTWQEWAIAGLTLIIYFRAAFNLFVSGISEKIRTVCILKHLYFSSFVVLVLLIMQSEYKSQWAMIIYIPAAIFIARLFTLTSKKSIQYLMLFYFLFLAVVGIWN